ACLSRFQADWRQRILSLLEKQFPDYALPREVQSVRDSLEQIFQLVEAAQSDLIHVADLFAHQPSAGPGNPRLFKQMILRYRRQRAAHTEDLREKTFHPELTQTLDEEINSLDALVETDWFGKIEPSRLPRAQDFLALEYIEQSGIGQIELAPRQYDEKF